MRSFAKRLGVFCSVATMATMGLAAVNPAPASAAVTDDVPNQALCETGGSASPLWGTDTGSRTRPVIASMTVNGETVPDAVNPDDHKLGVAICTPFNNARKIGINVIHREGSGFHSDLTGALTPSGAPYTANMPITLTLTNLGSQAEFFTYAIVHGDVSNWTTANLGTPSASLSTTLTPTRTPLVDATQPGAGFCSATPPVCDAAKSELDVLSANIGMDTDEDNPATNFAGAYFALTGAVAGFVEPQSTGDGTSIKATLGGPHTLADGNTQNIGSMQAYLPNNTLASLLNVDPASLSSDDLSVVRSEGSSTGDAPFSLTPVTGGAVVGVDNIAFSTPSYSISSASTDESEGSRGYRLLGADGGVFNYGLNSHGSAGSLKLAKPIVGGASLSEDGYYLTAADGGVFAYGNAPFSGSAANLPLRSPIVGMAAGEDGVGYYLVAADGGVFAYGGAQFHGSAASLKLNAPIVGMSVVSGGGYRLFAADGGVFNYGTAKSYGSAGSLKLAKPVVGGASSADGEGYWMTAADGGVFAYGSAKFSGSAATEKLNAPVVGMLGLGGDSYALTTATGAVYVYGGGTYRGGANNLGLAKPIVGIS